MWPSASAWCSARAGLRDGDDEAQVEEQLERRRRAVRLVAVAAASSGRATDADACVGRADSVSLIPPPCEAGCTVDPVDTAVAAGGAVSTGGGARGTAGPAHARRSGVTASIAAATSGWPRSRTVDHVETGQGLVPVEAEVAPRARAPRGSRCERRSSGPPARRARSRARSVPPRCPRPWTAGLHAGRSGARRPASRRQMATRPARNRWAVPPSRSNDTSSRQRRLDVVPSTVRDVGDESAGRAAR